jgi:hypothetical protein
LPAVPDEARSAWPEEPDEVRFVSPEVQDGERFLAPVAPDAGCLPDAIQPPDEQFHAADSTRALLAREPVSSHGSQPGDS